MDANLTSPPTEDAPQAFHAGSCSRVGDHPWMDETGHISAKVAGIWMANTLLTAGVAPERAFRCATYVAEDIAFNPDKFR